MISKHFIFGTTLIALVSCNSPTNESQLAESYADVQVAGAMKNVMWRGELAGVIDLDTISPKRGLYGLGPVSYLKGELLITDGQVYQSSIISDTAMSVTKTDETSVPFFVYTNVIDW